MKVLFVCKKRHNHYGVSTGLLNSATFVCEALKEEGAHCKVVEVTDANDIDRVVTKHNPRVVIIEALWVTPDKMNELLSIKRHVARAWVVRIHSKIPFLAEEGVAIDWIRHYNDKVIVASNNVSLIKDLSIVRKLVYLPNIYNREFKKSKELVWHHGYINIGCFGAIRPLKNTLEQAVAAIKFANIISKPLRFHINAGRTEQRGDNVLKNLRALFRGCASNQLVEHPWYSHAAFIKALSIINLGLQISLSESFNIVTADLVTNGIPVVASREIDWLPSGLAVWNPTDANEIIDYMRDAITFNDYYVSAQQNSLKLHNDRAFKAWADFLSSA